jgi:TusA-related sulfurtransferase
MPIITVARVVKQGKKGDRFTILCKDPAFKSDMEAWSTSTGNRLISIDEKEGVFTAVIEKGK